LLPLQGRGIEIAATCAVLSAPRRAESAVEVKSRILLLLMSGLKRSLIAIDWTPATRISCQRLHRTGLERIV
jgi:hypothetical protein